MEVTVHMNICVGISVSEADGLAQSGVGENFCFLLVSCQCSVDGMDNE